MKTKLLGFSLFLVSSIHLFAQDFIPGYYIINSTAEYTVIIPSGIDYYTDEYGCLKQYEELLMKAGEVVIAYEFSKGNYYCFDPNGRMVVITGVNSLTKASAGFGVGKLNQTIELVNGNSLTAGSYFWVESQNIANSTLRIIGANGTFYDLPQEKITLWTNQIRNVVKGQLFSIVEE